MPCHRCGGCQPAQTSDSSHKGATARPGNQGRLFSYPLSLSPAQPPAVLWADVEPSLFGTCRQVWAQPLKLPLDFLPHPHSTASYFLRHGGVAAEIKSGFLSHCLLWRSPFANVEGKLLRFILPHNTTAVFFLVPLFNGALNRAIFARL